MGRFKRSIRSNIKKVFQNIMEPVINTEKGIKQQILNRDTSITAGLETQLRNPDKLLHDKNQTLELYDKMMLDGRIKFSIELVKALILHIGYDFSPASEDEADNEITEFVKNNFNNLSEPSFDDVLDNLLDSKIYGFKIGEIIWNDDLVDGKYTWRKVYFQHPILFDFEYDNNGDIKEVKYGYYQCNNIPIDKEIFKTKFLYMCNPYLKDGNYYGDSDLKELYFEWWSKFNIKRFRNIYLQNYGMPIPIITYDSLTISQSEKADLDTMLENWQDQMYVKIPATRSKKTEELIKKIEIEFKDTNVKGGTTQYEEAIKSIDTDITWKLLIPSHVGFTDDTYGARAQTENLFDLLLMVIRKAHKRLEAVINPHIKYLVDLNFVTENYPKFKFNAINEEIASELLKILFDYKVIDKRESWIRRRFNIPELSQKEKEEIEKAQEEDKKDRQQQFQPNNPFLQGQDNNQQKKEGMKLFKRLEEICNFKKIESQYNTYEQEFIRDYEIIYDEQVSRLIDIIKRRQIIENSDMREIEKLRIVKGDFKKLFGSYFAKLYISGKIDAIEEIDKRIPEDYKKKNFQTDVEIENEWLDREWILKYLKKYGTMGLLTPADKEYLMNLYNRAFTITGETEEAILKSIRQDIESGLRNGLDNGTIIAKIRANLSEDRQKYSTTIARTNASDYYNTGRMNLFMSDNIDPVVEAFMFSAIIDNRTTDFCREHDGQIIKKSNPDLSRIVPPCHYNCRSLLIPILIKEDEQQDSYFYGWSDKDSLRWGNGVPSNAQQPSEGFGG